MAWVSIPVLIVVNLGGGALLINAGFVTPPEVLLATLVSMAVPTAIHNVANINWAYQLAGAAAVRLTAVLDAEGQIVQQGTHDELVAVAGPYQDFWEYRSSAQGWALL